MQGIGQFLQQLKTDSKANLVSMITPKGKFFVPPGMTEDFWINYCASYHDHKIGIAEMQVEINLPVLVDVDLKKETTEREALYTLKHVQRLVQLYHKVLREIVAELPDEHLQCFLLEKPAYFIKKGDKTFLKNGFHLHFPRIFLTRYDQETHLIPRIRAECKRLAPLEIPECVTPDGYIDRSYCKVPWLLYGSYKEGNDHCYLVSRVYDEDARPSDDWKQALLDYCIYSADKHKSIDLDMDNIDFNLPRIFSIVLNNRDEYMFDMKPDLEVIKAKIPGLPKPRRVAIQAEISEEVIKQIDLLMPMLSDQRAADRNDWIQVGWVLYNIFNESEEGYDRWVEFSRRCPASFDETVCSIEWHRMKKREVTIGTLKYMARNDSPEKYAQASKEFSRPYLEKCLKLDGTHHDLARALFQKYEAEFVCASIAGKVWYQFCDHVWIKVEEGNTLRSKISSEIVLEYEVMANEMLRKITTADSDEEAAMHKKKLNNIIKLIRSLKSAPYKTNVMREAMEVFYQDSFLAKLDTNRYLIGFQNGIYDLQNFCFRDGKPDDFVSKKMPIQYNSSLTMQCDKIIELHQYFEKIFPDRTVREYFLDISSEIFVGGNSNKIVQVWTGEGDNGKSVTQGLFEKMLGVYNVKLPTSLITGKRTQSSAACPELCRAGNGVRFAMLQEPDQTDVINIGILKELSGNDTFFARGLYKEGSEITPMFKLVLICNDTPKLPYNDKAAWNRIRVIPFESVFTENAPETFEEQLQQKRFPKDKQFADKIPGMVEALAWFLLERFRIKPRVIKEPPKVLMATQSYQRRNDVFRQFIDELVVAKEGSSLPLNDMYAAFKDWFKESIPHGGPPNKQEVADYFNKMWGEPVKENGVKKWVGWVMRGDASINF